MVWPGFWHIPYSYRKSRVFYFSTERWNEYKTPSSFTSHAMIAIDKLLSFCWWKLILKILWLPNRVEELQRGQKNCQRLARQGNVNVNVPQTPNCRIYAKKGWDYIWARNPDRKPQPTGTKSSQGLQVNLTMEDICVVLYFINATDLKLRQLIWPAARGRCNDEIIRLGVRHIQFVSKNHNVIITKKKKIYKAFGYTFYFF